MLAVWMEEWFIGICDRDTRDRCGSEGSSRAELLTGWVPGTRVSPMLMEVTTMRVVYREGDGGCMDEAKGDDG